MKLLLPEVREVADDDLPDLYDVDAGPFMRAGFVVSVDGAVAVDGRSRGLSGPPDMAVFRALRTVADAVLVGAGTARAESYRPVSHRPAAGEWRAAHDRSPVTPLVIVTRSGDLPETAGRDVIVLAAESTDLPAGLPVLRAGRHEVDLPSAIAQLHERGLTRLLCEGGPALLRDLLAADLVDELCLTSAPLLIGSGPRLVDGLSAAQRLELVHLLSATPGPLMARWRVVRSAHA